MAPFLVTMSRPGGGSGTFKIPVTASTPDEARRIAENQYAGYSAQAVQRVK
jgi:hypothetical protein